MPSEHGSQSGAHPFTSQELDLRVTVSARADVPEVVRANLERPALRFWRGAESVDAREALRLLEDDGLGQSVRLPADLSLYPLIHSVGQISGLVARLVAADPSDPERPDWAPLVVRPAAAVHERRRMLRRFKGQPVTPFLDERIYDGESRQQFMPKGYPWQCIGKVTTFDGGGRRVSGGTATLVGRSTILTASHVLPPGAWDGTGWSMKFTAAYYNGGSLAGVGAEAWATEGFGWNVRNVAGNDMVVVGIDKPLGAWLGSFGAREYNDDWEDEPYWTHVGYPSRRTNGERPCFEAGIAVLDDDNGPEDTLEIEHHGDGGRGDSGGPLFGWWDKGPYIIGTMSGNQTSTGGFLGIGDEDNNLHAGGAGLVRLVRHGRNRWG